MSAESFAEEVAEFENADRRAAEAAIRPLYGVRQRRRASETEEKAARIPIDNFFLTHPDEKELIDPESGLRAFLRSGGETTHYEAPAAIRERNPGLYRRLEELGLFAIDADKVSLALKAGQLSKGDLKGYVTKGERTASLIVEEAKG